MDELNELEEALHKHGTPSKAALHERFEAWPIGLAMRLMAMVTREMASKLQKAGNNDPT